MRSQFYCTAIEDYADQRTAIVRGALQAGPVSAGMSLCIRVNPAWEIAVPIIAVLDSGELLVDCDDQEGVDVLLACGIRNESLHMEC